MLLCRAADKVSTTAAVGGQWANVAFKRTWDTTAEGIRRLTGNSLVVRCHTHTTRHAHILELHYTHTLLFMLASHNRLKKQISVTWHITPTLHSVLRLHSTPCVLVAANAFSCDVPAMALLPFCNQQ